MKISVLFVLIVFVLTMFFALYRPRGTMANYFVEEIAMENEMFAPTQKSPYPTRKPYSFYQQIFAQQKAFGVQQVSFYDDALPLTPTLNSLKIVGIILDANPQVVVEDSKTQKTYFLNEEDYIGSAIVKEIHEQGVILVDKGREMELLK